MDLAGFRWTRQASEEQRKYVVLLAEGQGHRGEHGFPVRNVFFEFHPLAVYHNRLAESGAGLFHGGSQFAGQGGGILCRQDIGLEKAAVHFLVRIAQPAAGFTEGITVASRNLIW